MNVPNPAPNPRERELFIQALEQPTDRERAAFLAGACGDDLALRGRVEALLARSVGLGEFLEKPVAHLASVQESQVLDEQAGTVIGRYKLLEKIGEGGMGVVYMAQQEEPVRRRVALKIIKLGMDTKQVVARFEAERQALALMDHPNIAKVLDGGATDTGRPYFVMELVQGVPITEYCDQNQLPAQERVKLFILVCQAIQSAHQKGIIHRDIKPTNILVTLNAGVAVPMVIDFGVAKATQQKLTEKTVFTNYATMIGTFSPPSRAHAKAHDEAPGGSGVGLWGKHQQQPVWGSSSAPSGRTIACTQVAPAFGTLAIDQKYGPVLLTVGCYEHGGGRRAKQSASWRHMAEQWAGSTPKMVRLDLTKRPQKACFRRGNAAFLRYASAKGWIFRWHDGRCQYC